MSLILDAINRSDQERADERPVPGLQSRHGPETANDAKRWHTPWLITICVLLVALLAVLFWPGQEGPGQEGSGTEKPAAPAAVTSPAPESVVVPAPVPAPADTAPATTVNAPAQTTAASTPEPVDTNPEIESLYVDAKRPVPKPLPGDRTLPRAGRLPPEMAEEPAADPAPEPAGLDADAIAEAARKELAAPAYQDSDLPLVNELNQRTRDEIPTIFFSEHTWSPDPSASIVTLNGERHQEGDNVAPGLTLVEILENSIVLDYRGTRFRLRSLNSWVNL